MIVGVTQTHLESFKTFRIPLFHKPVIVQVLFLDTWYNKLALKATQKSYNKNMNSKVPNWPKWPKSVLISDYV